MYTNYADYAMLRKNTNRQTMTQKHSDTDTQWHTVTHWHTRKKKFNLLKSINFNLLGSPNKKKQKTKTKTMLIDFYILSKQFLPSSLHSVSFADIFHLHKKAKIKHSFFPITIIHTLTYMWNFGLIDQPIYKDHVFTLFFNKIIVIYNMVI